MLRKTIGGAATPVTITGAQLEGVGADRLPVDANLQVGDADVNAANPVPTDANLQIGGVDVDAGTPVPVDIVAYIPVEIIRDSVTFTAPIAAAANLSDEIVIASYIGGNIYVPAAWTNADIGFYASPTSGGAFVPLYDDNGNLVQITVGAIAADRCCSIPPEVFGCRFIQLWSQLAAVAVPQGAERNLVYELKS